MGEKIKFQCTCGKRVSAPAEFAGKQAKCPNCGQTVQIPAATTSLSEPQLLDDLNPLSAPPISSPAATENFAAGNPAAQNKFPPPLPSLADGLAGQNPGGFSTPQLARENCQICGAVLPANSSSCTYCGHTRSGLQPLVDRGGAALPSLLGGTTATPLRSLSGGGDTSLAQAARLKTLKTARGALYVFGVLVSLAYLALFGNANTEIREALDKELSKGGLNRMMVDPVKLKEVEDAALRTVRLIYAGGIILGIVFIISGATLLKYPVPSVLTSLILFIGKTAFEAYLEPESLVRMPLVKLVVFICLIAAVPAAVAYQRGRREQSDVLMGFAE